MQLKNIYHQRKKHENDFVKYKELKREIVNVDYIFGITMHKVMFNFSDGNKFRLTVFKAGNELVLSHPKMWEYAPQKLAVLYDLAMMEFDGEIDSFLIIEDIDLYQQNDNIDYYKVAGGIKSPSTYKYSIHAESFHESHFIDYHVSVGSKLAKVFKFSTKEC